MFLVLLWLLGVPLGLIVLLYSVKISPAHDHEHPELDEWYATLMQPDNPTASCCGASDAY